MTRLPVGNYSNVLTKKALYVNQVTNSSSFVNLCLILYSWVLSCPTPNTSLHVPVFNHQLPRTFADLFQILHACLEQATSYHPVRENGSCVTIWRKCVFFLGFIGNGSRATLFRANIHSPWIQKKTLIPYIYNASINDPF